MSQVIQWKAGELQVGTSLLCCAIDRFRRMIMHLQEGQVRRASSLGVHHKNSPGDVIPFSFPVHNIYRAPPSFLWPVPSVLVT